jgi:ABC-2 type transport system permease protein
MNAFQRVATIISYEWKRTLARKKFIVFVIIAFVVQILIFVIFNYLFTNPPPLMPTFFLEQTKPMMWIVEALAPQGLFMSLVAIMISGGSMSEEYEHGTADILLSKPIAKIEYMTGKYLGGVSILSFVVALTTALGVILATSFFSPQEHLHFVPHVYLAIVYSNLVFLSLAFMFSEVFRRTTLALLSAVGIFIASMVTSGVLSAVYAFTQEQLYLDASKWLPNWCVSNFPDFVISELVAISSTPFVSVGQVETVLAGALIAVYTIVFIAMAVIKLIKSDVTKKTD